MSLRNSGSYPGFTNVGFQWMDDGNSPCYELAPGQLSRVGGTIFSGGPQANQASPGTALVNLWSMPVPPNFLNVVGRSLVVEATGYLTTDATAVKLTLQVLLGTIPLFTYQTASNVLASQTNAMWTLETWSTVVAGGTSTTSNIESHGQVGYPLTSAHVLGYEGDGALVSGNLNPDLTQANTLFITGQASSAHITNLQIKNLLITVCD